MLFDALEHYELKEYASDSEMEGYTGIVLDKDDNEFKVVTGQFHDKKDFYEKLSKRGMIVRKVFEQKVWRWMEDNAPNNLTAYLMFSTAFSKWKGNNVLGDYYVKLLNDIPQLNREKVKGDPKTMSIDKTIYAKESVLTEVEIDKPDQYAEPLPRDYYKDSPGLKKLDVVVSPLNLDGTPSRYHKPLTTSMYAHAPEHASGYKLSDIIDVTFLRSIYTLLSINHTGEAFPAWAPFKKFEIEVEGFDPFIAEKTNIIRQYQKAYADYLSNAYNTNVEKAYKTDQATSNDAERAFKRAIQMKKIVGASEDELADLNSRYKLAKQAQQTELRPEAQTLFDASFALYKEFKKQLKALAENNPVDWDSINHNLNKAEKKLLYRLDSAESKFRKAFDPIYKNLQQTVSKIREFIQNEDEYKKQSPDQLINTFTDYVAAFKKFHNKTHGFTYMNNDAKAAIHILDDYPNTPDNLQRRIDNMYNTQYAPSNAIRGGEMDTRFLNNYEKTRDLEKQLKQTTDKTVKNKKESIEVKEDAVNSGVAQLQSIQQDGGKPLDFYPTNGAMVPVGGLFVEDGDTVNLNPLLFDGDKLKPDVREALLKIADKFKKKLDLKFEPFDVRIVGSNSNYNYNNKSDIDLHLVYLYEDAGASVEVFSKYLLAQKKVFNSEYNITVKGIPVEVGCENTEHPVVAGGVYSLISDDWIIHPNELPSLHNTELPPYVTEIKNRIEKAIESHDSTVIGDLLKALSDMRKESLSTDGEFAPDNLMFKQLRAEGYLERLKQAYYSATSKELSLEALEDL